VARRQLARQTRTRLLDFEVDSVAVVVAVDGIEAEDEAAVAQAAEDITTIAIASRALGLRRAAGVGMTGTAVTALTAERDGLNVTHDPILMIANHPGSCSGPRWSEPPPRRHPRP
jgi:hypothetical protein